MRIGDVALTEGIGDVAVIDAGKAADAGAAAGLSKDIPGRIGAADIASGAGGADDSGTTVLAHPWMLQELTRNLLHNAIRHSPRGAALSVSVTQQGQRAQHAQLLVRDHGPGIAAELHARLFSPFVSGDTRQGAGLGLLICQDIVHALGGELRLENRVDENGQVQGLDALVLLPLASMADAPTA